MAGSFNLHWLTQFGEEAWRDVRYGVRTLSRARAFATVIVLTLGVGMGAAVGVFAVINATLINELPYPEADRLVVLGTDVSQYFSRPEFRRLSNTPGALEHPAAAEVRSFVLTSSGMPEQVWGNHISAGMMALLGLTSSNTPQVGRLFDPDRAASANELVITDRCWTNRFNRNPAVLGTSVTLDGVPRQIVGVLGPRMDLFPESEFLLPLDLGGPHAYDERYRSLEVFGRLPRGDNATDMEARLMIFFRSLEPARHGRVEYVRDRVVHGFQTTLWTMWIAALLVLLVCCLNFASLVSTRFWSRRAELALRVRLGATRQRLIRQLVTEGVLVSIAGGAIGLLLAWLARELLVKTLTNDAVSAASVTFDWRVIIGIGLACGGIGIAFTLQAARLVSESSVSGGRSKPILPTRRKHAACQIATAMVLIGTAGASIQGLSKLQSFDVGYDVNDAVTVQFNLPTDTYSQRSAVAEFVERAEGAISVIPGVQRVAATSALPNEATTRLFTLSNSSMNHPTYSTKSNPCRSVHLLCRRRHHRRPMRPLRNGAPSFIARCRS